MHVDRILAARGNQAAAEAESASGSRSFAINAARPTLFRSSPRRAVRSCVAIALARAARKIAELKSVELIRRSRLTLCKVASVSRRRCEMFIEANALFKLGRRSEFK